jgi:hypothetical protein
MFHPKMRREIEEKNSVDYLFHVVNGYYGIRLRHKFGQDEVAIP